MKILQLNDILLKLAGFSNEYPNNVFYKLYAVLQIGSSLTLFIPIVRSHRLKLDETRHELSSKYFIRHQIIKYLE